MRPFRRATTCLLLLFALSSSISVAAPPPTDIREALLVSARKHEGDFPDGKTVQLTHFSQVCTLRTAQKKRIYVADQRSVLTGMPSPRGVNYIVFFDQQFRYLGKLSYASSRPLWCEGSRLFLFGDLDGLNQGRSGNVVDLKAGFHHLEIYQAHAYGSSDGILPPYP